MDPWQREIQYRFPARRSSQPCDLFFLGPDGVESSDDIGNWDNARLEKYRRRRAAPPGSGWFSWLPWVP